MIRTVMIGQVTTHTTLLARLSAGVDPSAWEDFHDRYADLIRRFAVRRGLQAADCDDIVQDTLMALSKAMPQFRYEPGRGSFRSYLKTVVLHAIFRRLRQKRGERLLEEVEAVAPGVEVDGEADGHWEAEWRQYHLRLAMRRIEAEFNEKDRAAFDAYAVGGRPVGETAEELGLSTDQVYQAKSRILKRLCQLVEEQVAEEG